MSSRSAASCGSDRQAPGFSHGASTSPLAHDAVLQLRLKDPDASISVRQPSAATLSPGTESTFHIAKSPENFTTGFFSFSENSFHIAKNRAYLFEK
jgi:hypothetical protein